MKTLVKRTLLLVVLISAGSVPAGAGTLDPMLNALPALEAPAAPGKGVVRIAAPHLLGIDRAPGGELMVGVNLHLDGALPDLADVPGLVVGSVVGSIATARLPVASLRFLDGHAGIRYVEAARRMRPVLDIAVPAAQVDDVWNGAPAYTGAGVLMGVIDSGIDWAHDDFRNPNGTTRLKGLWDLYATGGVPPTGFTKGVAYTEAQINSALTGAAIGGLDLNGHGTHVMGIAGGNGRASSGTYRGVARDADLLFVKPWNDSGGGGFASNDVIDAMNWMAQQADALDQPLVVNMSLGGHFGAHDGTSAQEKVIDQLSGTGVVFVVAAGNEGEDDIHDRGNAASKTFTLDIPAYTPNSGAGSDWVVVTLWADGAGSPTVTVTGPGGGTSGTVASGASFGQNTANGTIIVDNATTGNNSDNGDKEIYIELDDQGGTEVTAGTWTITVAGGSGSVDAWIVVTTMTATFPASNNDYSVGMPGTSQEAISVAAWKSRQSWPSVAGPVGYSGTTTWGQAAEGDLAPFSSRGPSRDGREKPDLAGPGMAVVSCYSKDNTPPAINEVRINGLPYYATQGTSMSSPFVAGVAALLFDKNPTLSATDIRGILRSTSSTDGFTGATWNRKFGDGKVDAAAAMAAVSASAATGDVDLDGTATVVDLVRLVNYILDPGGHPLSADARNQGDVFPAGGGDGTLNVSDVTRIVAFILGTDTPSAPAPAEEPALLAVGTPVLEGAGWVVPVTLSGDALAGGQFALTLPGALWRADAVTASPGTGIQVAGHAAGDQIRVLLYDPGNRLPADGVTLKLPFAFDGASPGEPRVTGALAADRGGFARELTIGGDASALPLIRFLQAAPNPIREGARIQYQLARPAPVNLIVYDIQGRRVRTLIDGPQPEGAGEVTWDGLEDSGRRVAAGVYLLRLAAEGRSETRKLVVER